MLSLEVANAFNTISRQAVIDAAAQLDALAPIRGLVMSMYGARISKVRTLPPATSLAKSKSGSLTTAAKHSSVPPSPYDLKRSSWLDCNCTKGRAKELQPCPNCRRQREKNQALLASVLPRNSWSEKVTQPMRHLLV